MTGVSTSCGACKFLRRKCTNECVFAPYFSYNEAVAHFGAVHKVFGASNVSKLLIHLPEQFRGEAALTISFEALARIRDPIHGCVAYIYSLQQEVANLQVEIEVLENQISNNNTSIITGIMSNETCGGYQDNYNPYIMTNNHSSLPLLSSQEDHIINPPEILSDNFKIHPEDNSQTKSFCEFDGQNLIGVNETWSGFIEELLLDGERFFL